MLMVTRLKFPIEPLVIQMLDQLPADVWTSSTTTFLDPAMGGGQFLVEIQRRLRAAGHGDLNIAERMYGCESNILRVNYSKNNKKLVTNKLFVRNSLDYDWGDMKFDVIVGNPPYNEDAGEERLSAGNSNNSTLYTEFVKFSLSRASYVALVIPAGWTMKDIETKLLIEKGLQSVRFLGESVFGMVKIRSGVSVVTSVAGYSGPISITTREGHTYQQSRTDPIRNVDKKVKTILTKLSPFAGLDLDIRSGDYAIPIGTKGSIERLLELDLTYNSLCTKKHSNHVLMYVGGQNKLPSYAWSSMHQSSAIGVKISWAKASDRYQLGKVRILENGTGVSQALYYASVKDAAHAAEWVQWLEHPINKFVIQHMKTNDSVSTFKNCMNHLIDIKHCDRTDVYGFFDLSQEEIDLIETTVK
jgi:hypothetical protein